MAVITAKVKLVDRRVSYGEGDNRNETLTFNVDYAAGRNKEWAQATPWLTLQMGVKGAVADLFEAGKAYTLQFVEDDPVDDAAPVDTDE